MFRVNCGLGTQASSVSSARQAHSPHAAPSPFHTVLPGQKLAGFSVDNGDRTFERFSERMNEAVDVLSESCSLF